MKKLSLLGVFVLSFLFSSLAGAAGKKDTKKLSGPDETPGAILCKHVLSSPNSLADLLSRDKKMKTEAGNFTLVSSGRDKDLFEKYAAAAKEIFGENGIAHRLGIGLPPHFMTMVPSDRLAILATLGRHAIPHWLDGMRIAREAAGAAGVLEFVTPGCPTCRSFYRDTTGFSEQISILFHVVGHNDFSVYSQYAWRRQADPIVASLELAEMVHEYALKFDHDAVHLFYQYLNSFSFLQDLNFGDFTHPDHLSNQRVRDKDLRRVVHADGESYRESGAAGPFPTTPTISGLQAIVGYLKANGPEWKYRLAAKYEEMVRVYGYVPTTKIMNEGWATFMQIFLTAHSSWGNSNHILEFSNLLSGVAFPRLSNPYWLGLQSWLRVYKRFIEDNPQYSSLPLIERDKKFVEHAHKMISWMTDTDFLRAALDEQWIRDQKLILYRTADRHEQDPNLPVDPLHPENNEQKIVLSSDPKRVVEHLIDRFANKRNHLPRILVKNMRGLDRNVFQLEHEVFKEYPLDFPSAAKTLYVISQTIDAPVALDTIGKKLELVPGPYPAWWPEEYKQWFPPPTVEKLASFPIRIEVDMAGKVTVYNLSGKEPTINFGLNGALQMEIAEYQNSVSAVTNGELDADWRHLLMDRGKTMMRIADYNSEHIMEGIIHDPNSAAAVQEYLRVLKSIGARLRDLIKKGMVRPSKNGYVVRGVLPDVPEFQFDREIVNWINEHKPPEAPDANERIRPFETSYVLTEIEESTPAIQPSFTVNLNASPSSIAHQLSAIVSKYDRADITFAGLQDATPAVREILRPLLMRKSVTVGRVTLKFDRVNIWFEGPQGQRDLFLKAKPPSILTRISEVEVARGLEAGQTQPGRGSGKTGDKFWGPRDDGSGGPGERGEPGEEPGNPQDIEITLEDYGKLLSEDLELPNLRRTNGRSQRVKFVPEGSVRKPDGEVDWIRTVVAPNAYGAAVIKRKLQELHAEIRKAEEAGDQALVEKLKQEVAKLRRELTSVMDRVKRGMTMTTEADYYTDVNEPIVDPDFDAVVFFMVDMSGSMAGARQETAKNLSRKIIAILRHHYKNVHAVYVGFDTRGHEFDEKDVFRKFLGGGTMYSGGFRKVEEIYPRFPANKFNRFLFTFGDGESSIGDANQSIEILNRLYPETQYMGFGYLTLDDWGWGGNWSNQFTEALKQWGGDKEWFGFAEINEASEEKQAEAIREFLGKKKK